MQVPGRRLSSAERQRLLRWYQKSRRAFPWRQTRDAYRIWVSEVMLQQTRAEVVVPYYRAFLRRFPTVDALAHAPEEAVLRYWAGLGYYNRARHLHRAAQQIVAEHRGVFPSAFDQARQLPGVGDYTARAVLSIAYGQPLAVVDGNVARVLTRWYAIENRLPDAQQRSRLQQLADAWLDRRAPGIWNQALMELGARICRPRQPRCEQCPLAQRCWAYRRGLADTLPTRRRAGQPRRIRMRCWILVNTHGQTLLVRTAHLSPFFARLWHFPAERLESTNPSDGLALGRLPARGRRRLPLVKHVVTSRLLLLEPWLVRLDRLPQPTEPHRVLPLAQVTRSATSNATKKLARLAQAELTACYTERRTCQCKKSD